MNKMQVLAMALSGLTREQVKSAVEAAYCTPGRRVPTTADVYRHVLANQPPSPPLLDPVAAAERILREVQP